MKIPSLLPLLALLLLAQEARAQSRPNRRGSSHSSAQAQSLGSVERTRLLERSKAPAAEARLGSAERRALLSGSRTSLLYPKPKRPSRG